jgi:hypothetical protein
MRAMSEPGTAPRKRRKYWIMFIGVPLLAALVLLVFLLLIGESDRDAFVYTLF